MESCRYIDKNMRTSGFSIHITELTAVL